MKNKLTRTGFVAWLKSKHPRTRVGQSYSGILACPLAKFTGVAIGGLGSYFPRGLGTPVPLPRWANNFVKAVDAVQGNETPQITAKQALALLGEK